MIHATMMMIGDDGYMQNWRQGSCSCGWRGQKYYETNALMITNAKQDMMNHLKSIAQLKNK